MWDYPILPAEPRRRKITITDIFSSCQLNRHIHTIKCCENKKGMLGHNQTKNTCECERTISITLTNAMMISKYFLSKGFTSNNFANPGANKSLGVLKLSCKQQRSYLLFTTCHTCQWSMLVSWPRSLWWLWWWLS